MARLQAPHARRSAGTPLNRFLSLMTFVVIFATGWVAVSYLKSQIAGDNQSTGQTALAAVPLASPEQGAVSGQSKSQPTLVYASAGDTIHFHVSTHVPTNKERTALSEETARSRGLKPCPVCIRRTQ